MDLVSVVVLVAVLVVLLVVLVSLRGERVILGILIPLIMSRLEEPRLPLLNTINSKTILPIPIPYFLSIPIITPTPLISPTTIKILLSIFPSSPFRAHRNSRYDSWKRLDAS